MKQELRQIVLPILMKNLDNTSDIYNCAEQLVEELCKKLSMPSQSDQV